MCDAHSSLRSVRRRDELVPPRSPEHLARTLQEGARNEELAAPDLVGPVWQGQPEDLLGFPWLQELGTDEAKLWLARQGVTEGRVKGMTEVPGSLLLDGLRTGQGVAATTRALVEYLESK